MNYDIGFVNRCAQGEHVSGDAYTIDEQTGTLLVSVIDGLGHGPNAAVAAGAFPDVVAANMQLTLSDMMAAANQQLSHTRGAAAALLRIDSSEERIDFVGVGNIHLHTLSPEPINPVCAPGIVGHRLRKILPFGFRMPEWGLFAMCSDGISSRIEFDRFGSFGAQDIADALLEEHGKYYDDATCVVVKYHRGG